MGKMPMPQTMKTIATFGDGMEANLARNYLESVGIPAFIADEQTVGIAWHLTIALGGVKLQVADEIATEARTALAERHTATAESTDEAETASATPDEAPEELEPPLTLREQNADRAWRGAIICVFFFP